MFEGPLNKKGHAIERHELVANRESGMKWLGALIKGLEEYILSLLSGTEKLLRWLSVSYPSNEMIDIEDQLPPYSKYLNNYLTKNLGIRS